MASSPGLQTVTQQGAGRGSLFSPPPEPVYPPIEALFDAPRQYYTRLGLEAHPGAVRVLSECRWSPVAECSVAVSSRGGEAPRTETLIVKGCYRSEGSRVARLMGALWEAAYHRQEDFRIPEPVAYLPESRIFLQRPAVGQPLHDWLLRPRTGPRLAAQAGGWLAHFHRLPLPRVALPDSVAREAGSLAFHRAALLAWLPEERARLEAFFAVLEGTFAALGRSFSAEGTSGWTLTHGDYQPKNILVADPQVTVIDFDRSALAPPARDVAYFAAQSLAMAGSPDRARAWNAAFLSGYFSGIHPGSHPGVPGNDPAPHRARQEARLPYFNAYFVRSLLEILFYKIYVMADPERGFVPVFLDECERRLPI